MWADVAKNNYSSHFYRNPADSRKNVRPMVDRSVTVQQAVALILMVTVL